MQTAFYSLVLFLCSTLYTYSQYSEIVKLDTSTYPQMKAEYLVFDKQGNVSTDGRFELYENGSFKKIKKHTPPQEIHKPLSILIVLDMSCRYDGIDGTPLQQIAQQWLEYIHPDDEIGIVVHDVKNTLVADYTNNTLLLSEKLKTIETHPTDQRKESTPNDTLTRARHLVTKAKNKAIIIFISQSFTPRYTSYWIETDSTVPTYTINRERITPDYIRQVSEEAAGRNFNRTGNNTNLLYSRILYVARGGIPGTIEWDGEIYCEDGKKKLELYEAENDIRSSYDFYPSLRSINELHFSNEAIRFGGIEPGQEAKTEVMITSTRRDLLIKNIHSRNPQYRIEPRSVIMEKGKPTVFTIYYKSEDSNYTWTRFSAESDECAFTFDASAGYPGKLPKKNELRIVYPTEKDTIYYGEDFDIIWDGIADFEEVELYEEELPENEYEPLITKTATKNKFRFVWQDWPGHIYGKNPSIFRRRFGIRFTQINKIVEQFDLEKVHIPDANALLDNRDFCVFIEQQSRLQLWNIAERKRVSDMRFRNRTVSFYGDAFDIVYPHVSRSGRYMGFVKNQSPYGGYSSYICCVWDIKYQRMIYEKTFEQSLGQSNTHFGFPISVVFNKAETKFLISFRGNYKPNLIVDIRSGETVQAKIRRSLDRCSYSPDGNLIADGRTGDIIDAINFEMINDSVPKMKKPDVYPWELLTSWTNDSKKVVVGFSFMEYPFKLSNKSIILYDVFQRKKDTINIRTMMGINYVDINPVDGKILVGLGKYTYYDSLYILEYPSGKVLRKFPRLEETPSRWLKDGIHIIGKNEILNTVTGERTTLFSMNKGKISTDGKKTVRIEWNGVKKGNVVIINRDRFSSSFLDEVIGLDDNTIQFESVEWLPDSRHVLLRTVRYGDDTSYSYRIYNIDTKKIISIIDSQKYIQFMQYSNNSKSAVFLDRGELKYVVLDSIAKVKNFKPALKEFPIVYTSKYMIEWKDDNTFFVRDTNCKARVYRDTTELFSFDYRNAPSEFRWNTIHKTDIYTNRNNWTNSVFVVNTSTQRIVTKDFPNRIRHVDIVDSSRYMILTVVNQYWDVIGLYKVTYPNLELVDSIMNTNFDEVVTNPYGNIFGIKEGVYFRLFDARTFEEISYGSELYNKYINDFPEKFRSVSFSTGRINSKPIIDIDRVVTFVDLRKKGNVLVPNILRNRTSQIITIENTFFVDSEMMIYNLNMSRSMPFDVYWYDSSLELHAKEKVDLRIRNYNTPQHYEVPEWLLFMVNNIHYIIPIKDSNTVVSPVQEQDCSDENDGVVYPNPTRDILYINLQRMYNENVEIDIYDALGNKVLALFSGTIIHGNNKLEIMNLHTGNYFVVVKSSDKSKVYPFVVTQ